MKILKLIVYWAMFWLLVLWFGEWYHDYEPRLIIPMILICVWVVLYKIISDENKSIY